MKPNDTRHDTLSIYFDFLEDNNVPTEELREFSSKIHWCHEYRYYVIGVGVSTSISGNNVGGIDGSIGASASASVGVGGINHVGNVGISGISGVGGTGIFDGVGFW